ncbi:MAG: metallophosphoesterase [Deltaproteobacteria bacterium]|nr:metallophosphoesterase [Deltaproteobacteria bacterium]
MPTSRRDFLKYLAASTLVVQGSFLTACGPKGDTGEEGPSLTFAVLTDLHFNKKVDHVNNQTFRAGLAKVAALGVDLVLLTGDLLDELPSDDPAYYEEHTDTALHHLKAALAEAQVPVLATLGNHDFYLADGSLGNHTTPEFEARQDLLLEHLGLPAPWYREDHGGVAFYMLSSMQADDRVDWEPGLTGSFGAEQLAWLEEQLADGVPAVLGFHHPLALDKLVSAGMAKFSCMEVPRDEGHYEKYEGEPYDGWTDPIYDIIEAHSSQILAIFVGHSHWWAHDQWAGVPVMMGDSSGNSIQFTEKDGEPMRYHLGRVWLDEGRFEVWNLEDIPLEEG